MSGMATGKQLHLIASLCQSLHITSPIEENIQTSEDAGRMIRRLLNEQQFRKQRHQLQRHDKNRTSNGGEKALH